MLLVATTIAIVVSMALVIIRGIVGPSIYDRLLAANAFGTNIVLLIALLSFLVDDMMYLDVALVYALINFITTVALLKYVKYGSFCVKRPKEEVKRGVE